MSILEIQMPSLKERKKIIIDEVLKLSKLITLKQLFIFVMSGIITLTLFLDIASESVTTTLVIFSIQLALAIVGGIYVNRKITQMKENIREIGRGFDRDDKALLEKLEAEQAKETKEEEKN